MLDSPPQESPNPNPMLNEQRWIIHICRTLDEEDEFEFDTTLASIFNVPKSLLLTSPKSYVPQLVALGPYHHSRPELYEMERYKLSAAKRSQKAIPGLKLHNLVDQLSRADHRFRASYHKFLSLNGETLAWMMVVDSCFLLEFLQAKTCPRLGLRDPLLRDIMMLENQVPLFSLKKTLEFLSDGPNDRLYAMLIGLCRDVSPFVTIQESSHHDLINRSAHLLEFLYNLTIPQFQESSENADGPASSKPGPFGLMKRIVLSKPLKFVLTLPWRIISNLPGIIMLKQIDYFCFSRETEDENNNNSNNKHLLMEEITIPSVTNLSKAGVIFTKNDSGISSINFDVKTSTFHLPTFSIDVNTEVVMRNLVAYEACGDASRPLVFTRYTELMNGMIDSEDDARILRENGIILNYLRSDQDVADLWNGMSRSIRMTKVPFLDRLIEDVNGYYNARWKVRIGKLWNRSWQSITFFLLFFFVTLQSFLLAMRLRSSVFSS